MSNRMSAVLQAVNRRKRGVASVVSVGAIGALALGTLGTGVATAHGMVSSGEITNQTIQSQDIGQNGVGASELGPNAVHKWNINQNSVGLYEINDYARNQLSQGGERGPKGPKGDQGPKGDPGVSGYEADGFYTSNNPEDNPNRIGGPVAVGQSQQYTAECADGKYALSGGFSNGNTEPGTDLTIRESHPSGFEPIEGDPEGSVKATSWSVTVENETESEQHAQVFVVCANVN